MGKEGEQHAHPFRTKTDFGMTRAVKEGPRDYNRKSRRGTEKLWEEEGENKRSEKILINPAKNPQIGDRMPRALQTHIWKKKGNDLFAKYHGRE